MELAGPENNCARRLSKLRRATRRMDTHLEVVNALLASGANVNAQTNHGATALMIASYSGRADVVRALLTAKADAGLKAEDGETALSLATKRAFTDVISILRR